MSGKILIDASVLVALVDKRDNFHHWAVTEAAKLAYPFSTCEAVITEVCFLLKDVHSGEETILGLIDDGFIEIPFHLSAEVTEIRELMKRYQSVPMSLADACLVRMSELFVGSIVFSLDSDFRIYRRNKKEAIDLMIPDGLSS